MTFPLISLKRKKTVSAYRRGLRVAIWEGLPANVIFMLLGGPYLTGYLLYLGASPAQVGIVLAIPSLANVLQIAGAFLIQSFTNRKLALIMLAGSHRILWVATGAIPFLFPQHVWVIVYILIYGFAFMNQALASVYWTSLMADMVPVKVRGRYFGLRNMLLWCAGTTAVLVGGQVLDRFPGRDGFAILYLVCAVCAVLNIVAFFKYPNPPFEKSAERNKWDMFLKPFENGAFLRATLFISFWLLLQGISVPFFSYVMLDVLKLSYEWVSVMTTVQNVAMMASYYGWGVLNTKHSPRTLLYWTLPIITLSCLLWGAIPLLSAVPVLLVVHLLIGIGLGGFNQMMFNFVIGDTPKSDRPMFIAIFYALTGLSGFVGPVLGGAVYDWAARLALWTQAYGVTVSVGIVLAATALTLGRATLREPGVRKMSAAGLRPRAKDRSM